jgi:type I restriction enzyme S subunit
MNPALDITKEQRKTLLTLLRQFIPGVTVWAYGSRAKWTARPNSDLDLVAFTTPEQRQRVSELKEALAESNLPFLVDLHIWDEVPERFHAIICKEHAIFQEAEAKRPGSAMATESLGAIAEIIMGQSPAGETCNTLGNGLPLLNGPTEFGSYHPIPVQYTTDTRKRARSGDILFCVRGSTTGRMNWADREYAIGRGIAAIRHKRGQEFQQFVRALIDYQLPSLLAQATGSTFPNVSCDQLASLRCDIVDEWEQRAIASVLGAMDDKIELNRRMNETLEALARTLFQHWFVDATQAGLPKGWREGKVSDLATLSRDGLNPSEFPDETFDHYSIPAFDEGRTPKPEKGDTIMSNKFIVPPDCVMVSKLNPRIPRIWLPDLQGQNRAVCSTEFLLATPKPGVSREFLYCLFINESFISVFTTMVTGTSGSHQRVKPESLLAMDTVIPPQSLLRSFTESSAPLFQRINHNIAEFRTLAELRDALLPKLLSGEIRVRHGQRGQNGREELNDE